MTKIFSLKRGDEVVGALTKRVGGAKSGVIFGIGALSEATLKLYDLERKRYHEKRFRGAFEVGSFMAVVAKAPNGQTSIHPHIVISGEGFLSHGGHLESGIVSATFEAVFLESEEEVNRYPDKDIGLNLIK